MYRRIYILVLFTAFTAFCMLGQTPTLTIEAAKLYEQKEFEKAKEKSDQSIASEEGMNDSYTWHVRGHIYKEVYKTFDNRDKNSLNREKAVEAFFKAMELDTEKKFYQLNYNVLKTFFIPSYYNDVVHMIRERNRSSMGDVQEYYNNYRTIQLRLEPDFNLNKRDISFAKAYATSYRKIIERDRNDGKTIESYQTEYDQVRTLYKAAIRIDSMDYGANYNLAINLYNEAAFRIENLADDAPIDQILKIQKECVAIFKEALPYALTAFKLKPERIEINKALRAIYYSLLLDKKMELFKENLESIKKLKALDGPEFKAAKDKFDKEQVSIHKKCVRDLEKDLKGTDFNKIDHSVRDIFEQLQNDE